MNSINIYWRSDSVFEQATVGITTLTYLQDILTYIGRTEVFIPGLQKQQDNNNAVMEVENLIVFTDDYGAVREWALLGFTKNILQNIKLQIKNLWLNNPPQAIYDDIIRNNNGEIIKEHHRSYSELTDDAIRKMVLTFSENIVGQDNIIKHVATALYSLRQQERKRPITLLFLGESGVGKTETAKFIGSCMDQKMVRIQFSMQQTAHAYQFIFGAEHGENSLARELIRRESNIILLDEFDKVPAAFYNAFYQMFDEGVFVDANYTVDVSKSIIICTSNYLSEDDAEKQLGTPIFSRFSKIIKFNAISKEDRIKIAQRCIDDIIMKLPESDRNLVSSESIIKDFTSFIQHSQYMNMRMLKNDIEDAVNFHILGGKGIL